MKILVPIAKVPDTTSKVAFVDNNTKFSSDGVTFIMNPTDEWYALVRAIELKEKQGGEVVVIHVGLADSEQIIRKALAIGADKAVRVDADPTDAYFVAAQIAAHAKSENYDLIIAGKETIDYNSYEVGGMIAELLDYLATYYQLGKLYERTEQAEKAKAIYAKGKEVAKATNDNKTLRELNEALTQLEDE